MVDLARRKTRGGGSEARRIDLGTFDGDPRLAAIDTHELDLRSRFICGVPMKLATKMLAGLANTSCGVADLLDDAVAHDGDAVGHGEGLELVVGDDHRRLGQARTGPP